MTIFSLPSFLVLAMASMAPRADMQVPKQATIDAAVRETSFRADALDRISRYFVAASRLEESSLIVFIDPGMAVPVDEPTKPVGRQGFKALAGTLGRSVIEGDFAVMLLGSNEGLGRRTANLNHSFETWLKGLSESQRKALPSAALVGTELSEAQLDVVARVFGHQGLPFVLFAHPDKTRVSASAGLGVFDATSGQMLSSIGSLYPQGDDIPKEIEYVTDPNTNEMKPLALSSVLETMTISPLKRRSNAGRLDFAEGGVYTLRTLNTLAGQQLNVQYDFDEKLALNLYFVSGKYDVEAWQKVMDRLTETTAARPRITSQASHIEELFYQMSGDYLALMNNLYTLEQLRKGVPMKGAALAQFGERMQKALAAGRIKPDQMVIIRPFINWGVILPGIRPAFEGVGMMSNRQSFPVFLPF